MVRALAAIAVAATLVAIAPAPLRAQTYSTAPGAGYRSLGPATSPVATAPGRGVSLGDMRLHPGLALGGGFNSNVFYEEELEGLESAGVFLAMPSLRLETPNPSSLRLRANAQLLWEYYGGESEAVRSQGGIDVLGDIGLQIAPRGIASATVYDVLRRYSDSPQVPLVETRSHLYNELGLILAFHPGGADRTSRRGFTASLGGGYGLEVWDEELQLDRDLILARLEVKYHFLPKTALYLRGSLRDISYDVTNRTVDFGGDDLGVGEALEQVLVNVGSTPMDAVFGIAGLLTRHIDFALEAGYAVGNYETGQDYASWIANAQLGVYFTPDAHLTVGWRRGYSDTSFSNFYESDRFSGNLDVRAGDFLLGASASYDLQRFATVEVPTITFGGTVVPLYSTANREDPIVNVSSFVAWNATDWARLTASYGLQANLTDFVVTTGQASGPGRQDTSASQYVRHQVLFLTEFEY
jgi:hypothetical protein